MMKKSQPDFETARQDVLVLGSDLVPLANRQVEPIAKLPAEVDADHLKVLLVEVRDVISNQLVDVVWVLKIADRFCALHARIERRGIPLQVD